MFRFLVGVFRVSFVGVVGVCWGILRGFWGLGLFFLGFGAFFEGGNGRWFGVRKSEIEGGKIRSGSWGERSRFVGGEDLRRYRED